MSTKHYHEEITLSSVAGHFHISPSHLSELFKKHLGENFVHFLHELRVRHACRLLLSTDMTVSDIALEAGFGSYNTFSRVFRESQGVTPTEYRQCQPGKHSPN